jgi:hypothetical protein
MGSRVIGPELRRFPVGRGGSGAFAPIGMGLALLQKVEIWTPRRTQDENQAGNEEGQGCKGDERWSIRWMGHRGIIAPGFRLATVGPRP